MPLVLGLMNILVTAGNTQVLIDRVRCLTNVFSGRTGTRIALHAHDRGHVVTLLTSRPEVVSELCRAGFASAGRWSVRSFQTFEDLQNLMAEEVSRRGWDVLIHAAAVSDYQSAGIYAPAPGTRFSPEQSSWETAEGQPARLIDRAAGKVKSDEPELWLRLVRAPKLVDRVQTDWSFSGVLVKFKLEVGTGEEQLLQIAEQSRQHSRADLMVANTLEGADAWAYLGPVAGRYQRVDRPKLAERLLEVVEQVHKERFHG